MHPTVDSFKKAMQQALDFTYLFSCVFLWLWMEFVRYFGKFVWEKIVSFPDKNRQKCNK